MTPVTFTVARQVLGILMLAGIVAMMLLIVIGAHAAQRRLELWSAKKLGREPHPDEWEVAGRWLRRGWRWVTTRSAP